MSFARKKKRNSTTTPVRWFLRQSIVGGIVFIFLGLLVAGIWYGTRWDALTLGDIEISEGPTVNTEIVEKKVAKELEGNYFALVPKRFIWLYPEETIKEKIEAIAKVDKVKLEVNENNALEVSFTEHRPYALWCKEADAASCLYVTKKGYAFAEAPDLKGGSFYRYRTPEVKPVIGTRVSDKKTMADIIWFAERLEEILNFYPSNIIIYTDKRITYERRGGSKILTAPVYSVEETFRYLETLLSSQEFADLMKKEFQYIDVRFGNKLFIQETELEKATTSDEVIAGEEDETEEVDESESSEE